MDTRRSPSWSARLRAVFGADPSELKEAHIGQLVEQGVREAVDLDFKRDLYGSSDNERREFAGDSAALGNERGGVLLLGVEEDDGVATGVPGVDLNETEEARMQQIVLSNIEPHLPVKIRPIPFTDDSGRGVYALVVPPSPRRPHGVRVNAEYRYPRRDGTHTR